MKTLCATVALLAALAAPRAGDSSSASQPADPRQVLERLLQGNERYASGRSAHPNQSVARRHETAQGQQPIAVVLACADSRVAPELVFDQGLGDLFVVRNAGNLLDDHTLGSIEYAVEHLRAEVILVVGHEKCGAAKAALEGGRAPGHIQSILDAIRPSVVASQSQPGDQLDNLVRANAHRVALQIEQSAPILNRAVKARRLEVHAARYDLDTGKIEILD